MILPTFHTRFTQTKLAAVAPVFDYILVMYITLFREPPSILIKYKRIVTPNNIFIVLMNRRFD